MSDNMTDQFVTHTEFSQFRADVSSSFDRLFMKVDSMGDKMTDQTKTQWSPLISLVSVIITVVMISIAGYISHVSDGHPHRVEDKMDLHVHYIQKQIDEMKENRFTFEQGEDLKKYIDRMDRNGTLYLREYLSKGEE